jgi:hypothetical protein
MTGEIAYAKSRGLKNLEVKWINMKVKQKR